MAARFRTITLIALVFMVASPLALAAPDKTPVSRTTSVDCAKGQTLTAALARTSGPQVIEFTGACMESALIATDGVTLRGISGDAAIVGDPDGGQAPGSGVTVRGASNIVLEGFEVRGWAENGISVTDSSAATLKDVSSTGSRTGMFVDAASSAALEDCSFNANTRGGLSIFGSSHLLLAGHIEANENSNWGMLVSGNSAFRAAASGAQLELNDNYLGIQVQDAATGLMLGSSDATTINVEQNSLGIVVLSSAGLTTSRIEAHDNIYALSVEASSAMDIAKYGGSITGNAYGIWAAGGSSLRLYPYDGSLVIEDNGIGVWVETAAHLAVDGSVEIANSDNFGLWIDGGTAQIANVAIHDNGLADASLAFGTRVDFLGGNVIGSVLCEDTVLVRGDVSCPPPSPTAVSTLSAPTLPRRPAAGEVHLLQP